MEFQKNEHVTVTIEDMGIDGEGIGKVDGFTLFVKDAVVGDTVEARIVKNKKAYAYARLEKVLTPSPFRVEPKCPYYRQCGGCQLQAVSYEKQLEYKQEKIRNNLIRIGGFSTEYIDSLMEPIVSSEYPFRYRNKAQYPVGTNREGRIITGFYAGRTHSIIANTDCLLGSEENQVILKLVIEHMEKYGISAYDEAAGKGLVRHLLIRKGFTSGEIMVCFVINKDVTKVPYITSYESAHNKGHYQGNDSGDNSGNNQGKGLASYDFIPEQGELLRKLSQVKGMTSVSVSINRQKTNVIMGKEIYTIWGQPDISDTIHVRDMSREGYPLTGKELIFHISPLSFYQVNPYQTEKLYSLALEYADLTGRETVWDLYCGIGTISLFLAQCARKVYGVEVIPQAIEDARENARRNGIANVEFFVGKAEEVLPEFYNRSRMLEEGAGGSPSTDDGEDMLHPDVIVVDPPRKGCDDACLNTMLRMQPQRIVYVSCDSATLARDLKVLCDGGYELKKVRGVDMFSQGVHVETVVSLSLKKDSP